MDRNTSTECLTTPPPARMDSPITRRRDCRVAQVAWRAAGGNSGLTVKAAARTRGDPILR